MRRERLAVAVHEDRLVALHPRKIGDEVRFGERRDRRYEQRRRFAGAVARSSTATGKHPIFRQDRRRCVEFVRGRQANVHGSRARS
jgi:hypothetical protein